MKGDYKNEKSNSVNCGFNVCSKRGHCSFSLFTIKAFYRIVASAGILFCHYSRHGFESQRTVTITYDGAVQPTVPLNVQTNGSGAFSAIISVPDELAVGNHTIAAYDTKGDSASANFTVVDMQGPQGVQGFRGLRAAGQNGQDFNSTGNIYIFNGTNGVNGQNGLNGTDGVNGVNGTNGVNGLDFNATGTEFVYNGTDGLNGQNGANGINGLNGKDGTNGINGTTEPTAKL